MGSSHWKRGGLIAALAIWLLMPAGAFACEPMPVTCGPIVFHATGRPLELAVSVGSCPYDTHAYFEVSVRVELRGPAYPLTTLAYTSDIGVWGTSTPMVTSLLVRVPSPGVYALVIDVDASALPGSDTCFSTGIAAFYAQVSGPVPTPRPTARPTPRPTLRPTPRPTPRVARRVTSPPVITPAPSPTTAVPVASQTLTSPLASASMSSTVGATATVTASATGVPAATVRPVSSGTPTILPIILLASGVGTRGPGPRVPAAALELCSRRPMGLSRLSFDQPSWRGPLLLVPLSQAEHRRRGVGTSAK